VLINTDASEKRKQVLQLRAKILQAEQERIDCADTISISQARKQLRERLNDL
jgi:hypothetical protein